MINRPALFISCLVLLCCFVFSCAQKRATQQIKSGQIIEAWDYTFGTPELDFATDVLSLPDGTHIVAGMTSPVGSSTINAWLFKLDSLGTSIWEKSYYVKDVNAAFAVRQTPDNGFILAGQTCPLDFSDYDFLVVRTDAQGDIVWRRAYGTRGYESAAAVGITPDGGFLVAGVTNAMGAGQKDFWVVKLDRDGAPVWENTYGGPDNDIAAALLPLPDGGCIVAGDTISGETKRTARAVRLDSQGNVVWEREYQGPGKTGINDVTLSPEGRYVLAGYANFNESRFADAWILEIDAMGYVVWENVLTGPGQDVFHAVKHVPEIGYILAGKKSSSPEDREKAWVVLADYRGNRIWEREYGGEGYDWASGVDLGPDGEFVVTVNTGSMGAGKIDARVIKIVPTELISE